MAIYVCNAYTYYVRICMHVYALYKAIIYLLYNYRVGTEKVHMGSKFRQPQLAITKVNYWMTRLFVKGPSLVFDPAGPAAVLY